METNKDEWASAEALSNLPLVNEALQGFADDPTGDNGVMVVREVMRALAKQADAAPVGTIKEGRFSNRFEWASDEIASDSSLIGASVYTTPHTAVTDELKAKLLDIIGACYQIAGAHDCPEHALDVLCDPEAATPEQVDALLPYSVEQATDADKRDAKLVCGHTKKAPEYDHVVCFDCGYVHTDGEWGVASRKWFKNLDEAKFYKRHGRLPDAIAASAQGGIEP